MESTSFFFRGSYVFIRNQHLIKDFQFSPPEIFTHNSGCPELPPHFSNRRCRVRPPRLLFGELGVVRPWSSLEAMFFWRWKPAQIWNDVVSSNGNLRIMPPKPPGNKDLIMPYKMDNDDE